MGELYLKCPLATKCSLHFESIVDESSTDSDLFFVSRKADNGLWIHHKSWHLQARKAAQNVRISLNLLSIWLDFLSGFAHDLLNTRWFSEMSNVRVGKRRWSEHMGNAVHIDDMFSVRRNLQCRGAWEDIFVFLWIQCLPESYFLILSSYMCTLKASVVYAVSLHRRYSSAGSFTSFFKARV